MIVWVRMTQLLARTIVPFINPSRGVFTFQNVESQCGAYSIQWVFIDHTASVWRTSTPEPTTDGIIWTYLKDVTRYLPLFADPGTFILELDNIVETGLTGEYASKHSDGVQIVRSLIVRL